MQVQRAIIYLALCLVALSAMAAVPDLVSYQGRLVDSSGQPVTDPTTLRFRIYRGGDDQTFPSAGALVYHETTTVTPTASGVFSHFVGSGTPAGGCSEGTCALSAEDLGDGATAVWIEVMVDPDGTLGNSDDDVLLPRTRVGTVGYAYRVDSIEGAQGGDLSGDLAADSITARTGATLGRGIAESVALTFDQGGGADPEIRWDADPGQFRFFDGANAITLPNVSGELITDAGVQFLGGTKTFTSELFVDEGLTLPEETSIQYGPFDNPAAGATITLNSTSFPFADGNLDGQPDVDHVWMVCYNCSEGASGIDVPGEYSMNFAYEMSYAPTDGTRWVEHNWNFKAPGLPNYRPLAFILDTDFAGGYANPNAKWIFWTNPSTVGMVISNLGRVRVGDGSAPFRSLEVGGAGTMLIDAPSHLYFEGLTDDGLQTRLQAEDPTASRVVELPDRDGRVAVVGNTGGSWIVMAGDGANIDFDTGDEVCAASSLLCHKTFDFGSSTQFECTVPHFGGAGHTTGPHLFQALCRAP